jgi:hypothetical protein
MINIDGIYYYFISIMIIMSKLHSGIFLYFFLLLLLFIHSSVFVHALTVKVYHNSNNHFSNVTDNLIEEIVDDIKEAVDEVGNPEMVNAASFNYTNLAQTSPGFSSTCSVPFFQVMSVSLDKQYFLAKGSAPVVNSGGDVL